MIVWPNSWICPIVILQCHLKRYHCGLKKILIYIEYCCLMKILIYIECSTLLRFYS